MAWQSPASSSGGLTINLGTSDNLFIAAQVAVSVPFSIDGFKGSGAGQHVVILGTMVGQYGGELGTNSINAVIPNWLQIGATGRLQALDGFGFISYGNCLVENAGVISTFSGSALLITDETLDGAGSQIVNSGVIGGTSGVLIISNSSSTVVLRNSGMIRADTIAYDDQSSDPHIDTIINSGTMIGQVKMGTGDDLFDGRLGLQSGGELFGGDGNDRLFTGVGNQSLLGGVGNDLLMGGAGADLIYGGANFDYALYSAATSGVVANLATGGTVGDAKGDTFGAMEGLIGSNFSDILTGDTQGNRLLGGAGNDLLNGGLGNDTLFGQTGRDAFVFNTIPNGVSNFDRIGDYVVIDDQIRIDDAAYAGIGPLGTLAAAAFVANATGLAADATDRIIYNTSTGALYFDSNGSGAGGRVLMGVLSAGLAMTSAEFAVF